MLGFFSFTEVTDPALHRAYNEWHQLDHLPEQYSIDGIVFGQRWVISPRCRAASVVTGPLLDPCQYMTLYLMRDAESIPPFFALAEELRAADRFFEARHAHLAGAYEVQERRAALRVKVRPEVLPFRPARGIYVVVGAPVDGDAMLDHSGVAGVWQFTHRSNGRHIAVAFIDGDLESSASELGQWCLRGGRTLEWAGPMAPIDTYQWDWFAKLTPQ